MRLSDATHRLAWRTALNRAMDSLPPPPAHFGRPRRDVDWFVEDPMSADAEDHDALLLYLSRRTGRWPRRTWQPVDREAVPYLDALDRAIEAADWNDAAGEVYEAELRDRLVAAAELICHRQQHQPPGPDLPTRP